MQSDTTLIIGGTIIIGVGVIHAAINSRPETRVFMGGLAILLLGSLLDAIGGPLGAKMGSGLVSIAALTVVLVEAPDLFQAFTNAQNKTKG